MKIRYEIIEKIGEGNRGKVYKIKLDNSRTAALKYAKNYIIEKEWDILKYLDGLCAPKPLFKSGRYIIMEYIDAKPLKEYVNTHEYYDILKSALICAYKLDVKGVSHNQLGRYYHILKTEKEVKFIDFERGAFSLNPRNFFQIAGYYLYRDENYDKKSLDEITEIYKKDKKEGLNKILRLIDESKYKKIFK